MSELEKALDAIARLTAKRRSKDAQESSASIKTLGETAAYLDMIWHYREDLGWLNVDAFLTADDVKMLIDFIYGKAE